VLEASAGKPARRLTYFSLSRRRDLQQAGERNATPRVRKLSNFRPPRSRETLREWTRDMTAALRPRLAVDPRRSRHLRYTERWSIDLSERERDRIGRSFRQGCSVIARPREDHNFEKRVNMEGFRDALEDKARAPARAANRKGVH